MGLIINIQPARGGEERLPRPNPRWSCKNTKIIVNFKVTYEKYGRQFASDVHVMRSPGEGRCKLPGEKESTDKDPNVEADIVEGGQEYQKEGGDNAASHGDDDKLGGQEHCGEEGAGQPAQAHPWAVEGVCQSSPEMNCIYHDQGYKILKPVRIKL